MKRVKTHDEARKSHLALQARRDALSRLRKGEIVTVRLAKDAGGQLVTVRPLEENEDPCFKQVLFLYHKRLQIGECAVTDSRERISNRRLGTKDIFGVVTAIDGVNVA